MPFHPGAIILCKCGGGADDPRNLYSVVSAAVQMIPVTFILW